MNSWSNPMLSYARNISTFTHQFRLLISLTYLNSRVKDFDAAVY